MSNEPIILNMDEASVKLAAIQKIQSASGLWSFDFRKRHRGRTLNQNAYLFGVVYPNVAAGVMDAWGEAFTTDEAHEMSKRMFLYREVIDHSTGEVRGRVCRSTTTLSTAEFSEYIDKIIKFAAEQLNVEIPPAASFDEPNPEPSNQKKSPTEDLADLYKKFSQRIMDAESDDEKY